MAELDEFNKHEEKLSKKGKAIAQQILKEQMEQAKKRDTQREEEPIENEEQMQDMERPTSPPHVSPSQYLTTPHNSPITSPVRT